MFASYTQMEEKRTNEPWWRPAIEIFGRVSLWVVVPVVAALLVGKWLDTKFGTAPWLFLGLTGVGFLISCGGIVLTVGRYMKKLERENRGTDSPPHS